MRFTAEYASPIGGILLASDGESLTGLWFFGQKYFAAGLDKNSVEKRLPVFGAAEEWLDIYFSGAEPGAAPPLRFCGSGFQKCVWELLTQVPRGETVTYGELARRAAERLGRDSMSAQAVGGAVGRNPLSVIVPCHRVVGANGSLTGYAGGVEKKIWLLKHEGGWRDGFFAPEQPAKR